MFAKIISPLIFLIALSTTGCQGEINLEASNSGDVPDQVPTGEDGSAADPTADDTVEDGPSVVDPREVECDGTVPGTIPLRRLTQREFNNSVRDIFPAVELPTYEFGPDETVGAFAANVAAPVGILAVEDYHEAAKDVAERVRLQYAAFTCGESPVSPECAHETIDYYAPRIFRRPLSELDVSVWHDLLDASLAEGYGRRQSTAFVLEGMLQSPRFLYRAQASARAQESDGPVALDDYELAVRLSYLFAGTIPDDELVAAAERGELTGPEAVAELERQARRLLDKPETRAHLTRTFQQWLGLTHLDNLAGEEIVAPDVVASMQLETTAFIDHILWEKNGSIEELLTAEYTFVDRRLAELYGVEFPPDTPDDQFVRVDLDPAQRRGVLTLPGVLAAHSSGTSSIFRGMFISDTFLCTPVPERPPQEVIDAAVAADDSLTYAPGDAEREVAQARIDHPACGACHQSMESVGLVFDNFGADGVWRETDSYGNSLTDEGEIFRTRETNGPLDGVGELATRLAQSPDVEACATQNWFKYLFARGLNGEDACTTRAMLDALQTSNGDMREMLVAVVTTDAFRYRTAN